jgi:hypothetical protein
MYKMCYHGFGGLMTAHGQPSGFDRVRQTDIGEWKLVGGGGQKNVWMALLHKKSIA